MQKLLNMRSKISSLRTMPMISSRASRASCRSMATNSGGKPCFRDSIPRVKPSALRTNSLRWRRLVTVTGDSFAQPRISSRRVLFSDSIPAPDLHEVASILSCWFSHDRMKIDNYRQIIFVYGDHNLLGTDVLRRGAILWSQRDGAIDHDHQGIGLLPVQARQFDAELFNLVIAVADPGGIPNYNRQTVQGQRFFYHISRGPWNRRDDDPVSAQQGVQQA